MTIVTHFSDLHLWWMREGWFNIPMLEISGWHPLITLKRFSYNYIQPSDLDSLIKCYLVLALLSTYSKLHELLTNCALTYMFGFVLIWLWHQVLLVIISITTNNCSCMPIHLPIYIYVGLELAWSATIHLSVTSSKAILDFLLLYGL